MNHQESMMPCFPDYAAVAAMMAHKKNALVWSKIISDMETPVSAMAKLGMDATSPSFLLESVHGGENRGRYSMIGLYPDRLWRCFGAQAEFCDHVTAVPQFQPCDQPAMASLAAELDALHMDTPEGVPHLAAGLVGYFGYDMIKQTERLPHANPDVIGIPDAYLMRPRLMLLFDNVDGVMYGFAPLWFREGMDSRVAYEDAVALLRDTMYQLRVRAGARIYIRPEQSKPLTFSSNMTREAYHAMVRKAKEYIVAGDIFQVVPSQRFSTPFAVHPFALYRALRYRNPSPFLFYLQMGDFSLVGSSPEILVRVRDDVITIRPIAGTRKRGATPEEDAYLEQELLADAKEIAEHQMLLDLGRNDVGRAAVPGTVKVTGKMMIERYSHVMHIVSNVEGIRTPDASLVECLMSGFPAGTVSGAPKIRAMEIIDELEPVSRSFYAGGVGYFSANGWMDTCITLRTALIKDGMLYIQAGGGVVYDSDEEAEYQESCTKARAIMSAAELAMQFLDEEMPS